MKLLYAMNALSVDTLGSFSVFIFNDRFYLSFFVATHGFRKSDFDYYSISYLSAHKSRPNVQCVYISAPLKSCPYKSSATCA